MRSSFRRPNASDAKIEDGPYRQRRAEPKQAKRVSGSPLEWKPVGRSDEGTPVRRQNKAQLLVPGSGHAESTGEVHTVPASWGRLNRPRTPEGLETRSACFDSARRSP